VDVIEPKLAMQKLAQDERRPALGEDLRAHRDWAELAVERHGTNLPAVCSERKFRL
jgi:hypothetical protein